MMGKEQQSKNRFYYKLIVAGFGGQGVMVIGNVLAYAAMMEGRHVTYLPVYGVEMRGGTANCTVVISSDQIGSPVVGRPHAAIVMNLPSLIKYEPLILPNGLLFINSSLIEPKEANRKDIEMLPIPVNEIAINNESPKLTNMVALGAFNEKAKLVQMNSLFKSLEKVLDERYHHLIPSNMKAIEIGAKFVQAL
ncbi:MAG TPA: 2-oxoacid:acceptor oxidoreductase family protein [Thermodesulfobacteriota bacterium]|nr:2-oxoacid:acceptor oxidoreductase family protein [Thermodesulfobacteriota bacterium]